MKYIWQIITILLAAALAILSISTLSNREKVSPVEVQDSQEDIILNSIMTRTSVRAYTNQKIEPWKIEKILKAGMSAPTAGNRQPWEFYVVNDTSIIKQFVNVTPFSAPMNEEALTAIVVCGVPAASVPNYPEYWVQDASAATENILLATHAMGLGAVWCGVYPVPERVATMREMLSIPEELTPLNIIMMGYPNAEQDVKNKWDTEKVHYVD